MAFISIVTPVFNEEENVTAVYEQTKAVFAEMPEHRYEHIFIDNASTDQTVGILRKLARSDRNLKVIVNNRNVGHIRSPYHAILQANGEAIVLICGDLQEPPALIKEFIKHWQQGSKVVLGIKTDSEETKMMFMLRRVYYRVLQRISEIDLSQDNTGFGLYDRQVIEELRKISDVYPYFRGLISELGFPTTKINFRQRGRKRGISKNNFYTLYDIAMLGITSHSKLPLRLATISGFMLSFFFLFLSCGYTVAKLVFWNQFPLGIAPLIIGMFFFFSVQLMFIGILGEYVASIHTQILRRPLVIERERINFDSPRI